MEEQKQNEKILFVCTANICRSPMAETIFRSRLGARFPHVSVGSAGFISEGKSADKKSVWALNALGLDLSGHVSTRAITPLKEKPDLVLVMAREHLRSLAELDSEVIECSFTLKEFVRLAEIEGCRREGEPLADYIKRVSAGRQVSAVSSPGREDDIEDPIGRRKRVFSRCASELSGLVDKLTEHLYP